MQKELFKKHLPIQSQHALVDLGTKTFERHLDTQPLKHSGTWVFEALEKHY